MADVNTRALLRLATAATAVVGGVAAVWRLRRPERPGAAEPDAVFEVTDRQVIEPRDRHGSPDDRGQADRFGLDVDRLKEAPGFEPVVQYLTYIQSRRDDGSHMLFVRYDDLDAMAEIDGAPTPAFLERLDQLGVVVSNN